MSATKTYRVGIETRQKNAIGVFEIRYCVVHVSPDSTEPRNDAARMAGELMRAQGYETRFPSTVDAYEA